MISPNQSPAKSAPKTPNYEETPPRGMWYEMRTGREQPFIARWRVAGKKDSQAFATAKERGDFARDWLSRRKKFGVEATAVSPREIEVWREFERLTGGANPLDVAQFWVRMRGIVDGKLSVEDACKRWVESQASRKLAKDSVTHRDLHLKRFKTSWGTIPLYELTSGKIVEWLNGLVDPKTGAAMSDKSKLHHRSTVNRMLEHAVASRWIDRNPCEAVPVPDCEVKEEVNILTVDQARELFTANRKALCLGRLALEAFAGIRYASAARIHFADVDQKERGIIFPGKKHKTGRRHYVDGFPANLWAWLKVAPEEGWEMNARLYLDSKRRAFERAGLKPEIPAGQKPTEEQTVQLEAMHNVLRHSFATYHLAAFKDAAKTAVLLTHRNPTMLYQFYKGRASEAAGKAYFKIMPQRF
ncbi:tyrosine-type recombinase/integrase [Geminisphaera colitermitum]|uniref:tyrosine-type recombinase/integrase n=1 Tax=Geminisphaera colitermitum TaxID=1148786 RepID=UPI0001964E68|nr:site-specific integrase [Geminisphaera colitermitum]